MRVQQGIDEHLGQLLAKCTDAVAARARGVTLAVLIATIPFAAYAVLELDINTDSISLAGEGLPSRAHHDAFAALFPNLERALFVVVDAENPELARDSAKALVARLRERSDCFSEVYLPGQGAFFDKNGLLYLSVEEVEEFADQTARVQPVLGQLERDPSLTNMFALIRKGLAQVRGDGGAPLPWPAVLDRVGRATQRVYDEYPLVTSWEEMFHAGTGDETSRRIVIVAHPILDFANVLSARRPLRAIEDATATLRLSPERGVSVRVTGNPALNHEEMVGIVWDIGVAGSFCAVLLAFLLTLALGSTRLMAASLFTLLIGLIWTAAFATAAVGHLNLISMAFGIPFVGLGVDFCIHLGMRYAELLRRGQDHEAALRQASQGIGGSLVICTITSAIGFLVFVPTNYTGVAELGLIAGGGIVLILILTFTLFPALLTDALRVDPQGDLHREVTFELGWWRHVERRPALVRGVAVGLWVAALALVPYVRFQANAVDLRDPGTVSVQAFNDLLAQSGRASPWYIDAVAPDLETAGAVARRLQELRVVDSAVTLDDYVPKNQQEKLEILADLAFLLPPPPKIPTAAVSTTAERIASIRALHNLLAEPWADETEIALASSMHGLRDQLGEFLDRIEREGNPERALVILEELLLGRLPNQIRRLRAALAAAPIERGDLPPELVAHMVAPDGQARIQIFPRDTLQAEEEMRRFVAEVSEIAPNASGIVVNLVEFGRACREAFLQALVTAVVLIALLLLALWRNAREVVLVLLPLVMASTFLVATMVVSGVSFNFVNILVVPLLVGIGVDSGVHLVHRAREFGSSDLLETTTARAVFYSALSTIASFGSLALSSHRGLQSLGIVLVYGMTFAVLCNLVVLPALLSLRRGSGREVDVSLDT